MHPCIAAALLSFLLLVRGEVVSDIHIDGRRQRLKIKHESCPSQSRKKSGRTESEPVFERSARFLAGRQGDASWRSPLLPVDWLS